jgi:hypothetical protein
MPCLSFRAIGGKDALHLVLSVGLLARCSDAVGA